MNTNLFEKKLLVLGGKPIGSVDIVKYAKKLGAYVIVCDYLKKENSPAKQYADECWEYSTADVDLIVEKAKEADVSAIFTGVHEFNIKKYIEIAKKLNLPCYLTKKIMEITSNKRVYKKIFENFDIPTIKEYKLNSKDDIKNINNFPILLKPIDSTGAYGLKICNSKEAIYENFENCLSFSEKREIIAEEYVESKEEITTVYLIKDGISYLASVADRIVKHFDNAIIPLPIQYVWNSKYLDLWKMTVDEKMKNAIEFMKLQNGMLFIQSIVKNNVIMPYDIGFRLSGTQEHIIIESVCGYNPLKLLVDYALSSKFGDENLINKINPHFDCSAAQITFLVKPATLSKFVGIENVEKMQQVISVIKNKQEGEVIPESALGTLNQVALRVFVKEQTTEKLNKLTAYIKSQIKIYSNKNEDIVIQ